MRMVKGERRETWAKTMQPAAATEDTVLATFHLRFTFHPANGSPAARFAPYARGNSRVPGHSLFFCAGFFDLGEQDAPGRNVART